MFTTTEGINLDIRPVSSVLVALVASRVEREYRDRGEPIDPPTYTTTTAAGMVEELPWTAEMLDAMDAETRHKWDIHCKAVARMQDEIRAEQGKLWLLQGVILPDGMGPDSDEAWRLDMELLKISIPDDPAERRLLYLQTAVLKTPADLLGVTQAILRLSSDGIPEEELAVIEGLFRRTAKEPAS